MDIVFKPIGYFKSPFTGLEDMPIQPKGGSEIEGMIEVLPEYQQGLVDLDGFSHVIVLNYLHECKDFKMMVKPFLDNTPHGVFATRSPKRPNPIGLSIMKLIKVEEGKVYLKGIDVLDGTPVIDIKPYVADFDLCGADRFGWTEGRTENVDSHRSDDRFVK